MISKYKLPGSPLISIGVTGHRAHRLNPNIESKFSIFISQILDIVLKKLSTSCFNAVHTQDNPQICMVSALAEGADRIFAREALKNKLNLCCVLPFNRNEYKKDFQDQTSLDEYAKLLSEASSVIELDYPRSGIQGYQAVGRKIVDMCDLMIALWDGEPARGPGGTAHVVEMTLTASKPVLWFPLVQERGSRFLMPGHNSKEMPLEASQEGWENSLEEWLMIQE
ncbi:conserved hypothetical protein [Desulfonatronospira thiodismutans ASO3-1]|uniref:Uncharacterized protein n=1 Tax=Desulfonatronospira thiodismutans ASO3-1 TaxID=555779 RepID=D6SUU9_9BACT|nr:hypothetical protein [Desulfonatronospira thiodismutans]EFI33079.1 conserved hypothetical protein [Desulfonatronospira thiodismutans ASO3-1]